MADHAGSLTKLDLAAAGAHQEEQEAYAAKELAKRAGGGSPRNEKSGVTEPVPASRRNAKTPRATTAQPMFEKRSTSGASRFVLPSSGTVVEFGQQPPKSPRRLTPDDKLTAAEQQILDLFKKLSIESQNKLLDAMEDHMDDQDEKALYEWAAQEEQRIKQAKLDSLKAEDELRRKADEEKKKKLDELRQEEERRHAYEMARREAESRAFELAERAQGSIVAGHREGRDVAVSPADAQAQAAAEAEAARLRALESAELRRIHELEIQLREQSEFGHKIGAHGAVDRDATNPDVDKTPLVPVNDPTAPASLEDKMAHQNPALLRLSSSSNAGSRSRSASQADKPVPAPRRATLTRPVPPVLPHVAAAAAAAGTADAAPVLASAVVTEAPKPVVPAVLHRTPTGPIVHTEEVSKSRNPRLASLMGMIGETPNASNSRLFADVATPEVSRIPVVSTTTSLTTPAAKVKPAGKPHIDEDDAVDAKRNPALARHMMSPGRSTGPLTFKEGPRDPAPATGPAVATAVVPGSTDDDVMKAMRSANRPNPH